MLLRDPDKLERKEKLVGVAGGPIIRDGLNAMAVVWKPDLSRREKSALTRFASLGSETSVYSKYFNYSELHRWSIENRADFWSRVWDFCGVVGEKGERVLTFGDRMPGSLWFPEARLNFAQNLLRDRPENESAIVFRGENKAGRSITFGELKHLVASVSAYLRENGVKPGDRVVAYMHNGPEAIVAMLAVSTVGGVWASCSSDFGVHGALERFRQIEPRALIVSDGYFYKGQAVDRLDVAREIAAGLPSVRATLVSPYIGSKSPLSGFTNARTWNDVVAEPHGAAPSYEKLPFDHPLYIMFSSGTTGAPKCIVHGAGGVLLQHLKEHQLHCDLRPRDRIFYATTIGWMMWNWLASALASRATILLYDGFPLLNEGQALFEFAEEERASFFGVSAGYLKAVQKLGLVPRRSCDLRELRTIASTGSPLLPESFDYVYRAIKSDVQLASISGGTDILSCFVCGNPWSPVRRGEIQGPGLGMDVEVWDEQGNRVFGKEGELVCTRSFPSMPIGFWNDSDGAKYRISYFSHFSGVWRHGDYATETPSGGFVIHGRSDATLNPHGVRIGTADIYGVVETMPEIEEALAVEHDAGEGARIALFVKMRPGQRLDQELTSRIKRKLREELSPRHVPEYVVEAPDLPHTRSGKLVELAVRDALNGRSITNIEALINPEALDFFINLDWAQKRMNSGAAPT
jgi:acetoacetyl-CoA synthetase